jgi:hypothetical protein
VVHWPVLKCPRLAGFQVSTEGLEPGSSIFPSPSTAPVLCRRARRPSSNHGKAAFNTTDALTATGESRHVEYTGKFDGKDNTVTGNPDVDTNTYRRIDDHTYEVVAKKSGKSTLTSRIVISPDGKTRTVTQTGKNPQGETVNNTVVYDRQ